MTPGPGPLWQAGTSNTQRFQPHSSTSFKKWEVFGLLAIFVIDSTCFIFPDKWVLSQQCKHDSNENRALWQLLLITVALLQGAFLF